MYQIHNGDCAEVMASMEDNSVDAIVTDPPYGLAFMGAKWDSFNGGSGNQTISERQAEGKRYADENKGAPRHANSHGKKVTQGEMVAFQAAMTPIFEEALRVAKPGAHLLCFGGTRTFHRMACAIEDAGWTVFDCIMWVYGSGFPKSMDVAKAIDKTGGIDPKKSGSALMAARERAGMSRSEVADAIGCTEASLRDWEVGRARKKGAPVEHVTPSPIYRDKLVGLLGFTEDERKVLGVAQDRRQDGSVLGLGHSGKRYDGAQTELAREWEGWGTCLKPAWEPIIVARKPLDGTVAHNVLTWGVGALNIDACRVAIGADDDVFAKNPHTHSKGKDSGIYGTYKGQQGNWSGDKGRFPANLVHDGSQMVLELFPDTGKSSGGGMHTRGTAGAESTNVYGSYAGGTATKSVGMGDSGSAARFFNTLRDGEESADRTYADRGGTNFAAKPGMRREPTSADRFFYCAKASKKDRNYGCERFLTWAERDQELTQLLEQASSLLARDISESMMLNLVEQGCSTSLFGNESTVLSQEECRFITSTVIPLITASKTCSLSRHSNTSESILDAIRTSEESGISLARLADKSSQSRQDSTSGGTDTATSAVSALFGVLSEIRGRARVGNFHCTVKPIALMKWLVTLVTPEGGVVLDPFAGSGTTLVAAKMLGRDCIGIEREPEYVEIIKRRLETA